MLNNDQSHASSCLRPFAKLKKKSVDCKCECSVQLTASMKISPLDQGSALKRAFWWGVGAHLEQHVMKQGELRAQKVNCSLLVFPSYEHVVE